MVDFAHDFASDGAGIADWSLRSGAISADRDLRSAVIVSLFTDARAPADAIAPGEDPRGWWGDLPNDGYGSLLWLLHREKQTEIVRVRAEQYARNALAWLIEDGVVEALTVEASFPRLGNICISIEIVQAGSVRRWDFLWQQIRGS
ncbi:MAG: phage GP46 family protein [Pseudomonadota bacterium]